MARHHQKHREEARRLYLTGEAASNAEIARRLKVKPHTVAGWKKAEDWDGLKLKIDRRAAEKLAEQLATERVRVNTKHFQLWSVVVGRMVGTLQAKGMDLDEIRSLERVTAILDKAQKGQRLARGMSLDGQTEEQIRAELEAELRELVDMFVNVVKTEVDDEFVRDRIARAIWAKLPEDSETSEEPAA